MQKKIPILALTGFLGAGKTSILNHLLKENKGLRIGVIVNDFGSINIDSMLVARQTDSKLELSNGCICCAAEESGLDDAIGQLAHAGSMLDYIVIEASGLAEPGELAFILENSKNKHARLDAVVGVIDAENLMDTAKKHPDFIKQMGVADILVLTKLDMLSAKQRKDAEGYARFLNERARILTADHGVIDSRLLLDNDPVTPREARTDVQLRLADAETTPHDHTHLHESFTTYSFQSDRPLDPDAFLAYLRSEIDPNIYRAKGFIYFGMKGLEQKFVLHLVGKRFELKTDDWRGQVPKTELVFIGTDVDTSELQRRLESLIDTHPDDIAGKLMDIALYR